MLPVKISTNHRAGVSRPGRGHRISDDIIIASDDDNDETQYSQTEGGACAVG